MQIEYSFWFWKDKLIAILTMLASLSNYQFSSEEIDMIKEKLSYTNDDKDNWAEHIITGKDYKMIMRFAYDSEEGTDMIHIKIQTAQNLQEKLETMNLFQSLFKELNPDN